MTHPEVTSHLWKTGQLVQSGDFLRLVRTAASQEGVEYTDDLVRHVAADPNLLQALVLPRGEGIDVALAALATDEDAQLDELILTAVSTYEPEENI